jgi:hypothetical protein
VDVSVVDRLAGRCPVVDTDVEGKGALFGSENLPGRFDHFPNPGGLLGREIKNARDMSTGHNERVPPAYWIYVVKSKAQVILKKNSLRRRIAERTRSHAAFINPGRAETQSFRSICLISGDTVKPLLSASPPFRGKPKRRRLEA